MVSVRVSLKLKIFAEEPMAAGENRFAPELNEKKVLELLQNATSGSKKKRTKYGMKIFQGSNFNTLLCQFKHRCF